MTPSMTPPDEGSRVVNKYDEAPRKPVLDDDRITVAYEKSIPVFGRWTYLMLSALRRLWGEAERLGDAKLRLRIEAAYRYLYSRDRRVKSTHKPSTPVNSPVPPTYHQQEKTT